MGKIKEVLKRDKKEISIAIALTIFMICAYLIYVFETLKEIPFIYNQF